MIRRARLLAVLSVLVGGAIGVIASTQTWIVVTLHDGAVLEVAGSSALPVLTPLSLAALALGGAVAIAGRVLRWVLGALALLIAVVLIWQTVPIVTASPVAAVAGTVTEATGISGVEAVAELVAVAVATAWPYVAIVGAALAAFGGVIVLATGHGWRRAGRRYDATAAQASTHGPLDAVDSWDDLSRGDDPTEGPHGDR